MKNAVLVIFLAAMSFIFVGCRQLPPGFVKDVRPGRTAFESCAEVYRSAEIGRQQFWDDWDRFWLLDKPSRLSELRVR